MSINKKAPVFYRCLFFWIIFFQKILNLKCDNSSYWSDKIFDKIIISHFFHILENTDNLNVNHDVKHCIAENPAKLLTKFHFAGKNNVQNNHCNDNASAILHKLGKGFTKTLRSTSCAVYCRL
jgi:hypothetical protein